MPSHSFFRRVTDQNALQATRRKYGFDDRPFILGLSTLQPRKNFARLIRAFHAAREEAALPHQLIIGGKKGWLFDEIFSTVRDLKLEEDVHFPGFIADSDLPASIRRPILAYLLFTKVSGFLHRSSGLERGAHTPTTPALPEAGGGCALYVGCSSL